MVNLDNFIDSRTESTLGHNLPATGTIVSAPIAATLLTKSSTESNRPNLSADTGSEVTTAGFAGSPNATPVPVWKHLLDWFCILLTLPFSLPLMLLIAAWIKVVSNGPVIFRQTRIGINQQPFTIFKFRTMKVNAQVKSHHDYFDTVVKSGRAMTKMDSYDNRVIPGGRLLRVTGLDELAQLFNVMQRKMSLVGPRPCLPEELKWYDDSQRARFECLPGLTGNWQVNGKNRTTFEKMIELDTDYARRMSLIRDVKIIAGTVPALIAYTLESRREREQQQEIQIPLRSDTVRIE